MRKVFEKSIQFRSLKMMGQGVNNSTLPPLFFKSESLT